ncbi:MAG: CHAT domain-containing protein, partial [Pseudomonadota bacterium]
TAIDFPASRRTFLRDRVAPFENAVSLLYGAGRLHEGRELAALATDMRHEATVSLGRRAPQPEIVPWTVSERAVLDLLANDRAAALEGLRNGSVWPRTPAKPLQDRTSSSDKPILRYPKAAQGYLVDCQTGTAARRTAVTATEAELATWIADLLDAAERGEVDEVSRAALFQALLGEVYDLVRSAAAVSVLPDGVIASIPFDLLCTEDPRPRFVYLPGNAAPRVAHSAGNRATLLIGDPDLQGTQAEAAALAAAAELTQEPLTVASLMEALSDPPKLLHISGHFQAVPGDASASAFLLATGETIELRDLAQLIDGVGDVAPELVFLSLCDSALQEATPEAAIDLPSLFLTLGARAVIGAAWKIADYDAAPFAVAFYTALAQGEEVPGAFATAMSKTGFRGFKLFQSEPL